MPDDVKSPAITSQTPPQASFDVVDDWLTISVSNNGQPMPQVSVRCLVGSQIWASGETDADGRGMFPRPKAESCQLIFDLGAGPSAPVPLTFLKDGHVVPLSAPILDGTAACCVIPFRMQREPAPSIATGQSDTLVVVLLLGLTLLTVVAGIVFVRMLLRKTPTTRKHPRWMSRHHHRKPQK